MRRFTMLAMVAVLALAGAACGGDDDEDSTGADTESGSTTTDADGGDDGASTDGGDLGLVDDDCEFLLAGSFLNPAAAAMSGEGGDFEDAADNLEAIADAAPDEIADAMETLAEGYAAMVEALGDVDFSDPQALADPDVRQQLDELEDVFDEEYEEAAQEVNAYVEANCGG